MGSQRVRYNLATKQQQQINRGNDKAAAAAKSHQSCLTLCDPIDGSPPGFPVPGILQARTLEWFAVSFSNEWKWKVRVKSLSRVRLFMTPWTAAYWAPPPMGVPRQEYWRGLPLPSPMIKQMGKNMNNKWIQGRGRMISLYYSCNFSLFEIIPIQNIKKSLVVEIFQFNLWLFT